MLAPKLLRGASCRPRCFAVPGHAHAVFTWPCRARSAMRGSSSGGDMLCNAASQHEGRRKEEFLGRVRSTVGSGMPSSACYQHRTLMSEVMRSLAGSARNLALEVQRMLACMSHGARIIDSGFSVQISGSSVLGSLGSRHEGQRGARVQ
eukprot:715591-Rhodomonas_salina.2